MTRNRKRFVRLFVIALLACLLASCIPISSEAVAVPCPKWGEYTANNKCDIQIQSAVISHSTPQRFDIADWDKLQFTFVKGELLVDNAVNLVVKRDTGEEIDFVNQRLKPGTYLFIKADPSIGGSFSLTNPYNNPNVSFTATLIRPTKKKQ